MEASPCPWEAFWFPGTFVLSCWTCPLSEGRPTAARNQHKAPCHLAYLPGQGQGEDGRAR